MAAFTSSEGNVRILTQLESSDMTVQQLIDNIVNERSGTKPKRHHLKHWLNHMFKRSETIGKASGTNWATCTWSEA